MRQDGWIYCIADRMGRGVCKVGFTTNVKGRFQNIQSANPNKLHLSYYFPGDRVTEFAVHQCIQKFRIRGEWFHHAHRIERLFDLLMEDMEFAENWEWDKTPVSPERVRMFWAYVSEGGGLRHSADGVYDFIRQRYGEQYAA